MKKILAILCSLFLCTGTMSTVYAMVSNETQEVKDDLRILKLLPNLLCHLAVEPMIPEDFIALAPGGSLDLYDWIYWGPRDTLEAYFKDESSLNQPILRVKLSANVAQTGPKEFNGDSDELVRMMKKKNPKGFFYTESQWGNYPILALRSKIEKEVVIMAWVGLNDPEAGWTLMFNLVYPKGKGHPNKEDCAFWEAFIRDTKQLTDGDFFKACGQDLQSGYTIVNIGGAKLKVIAEKRHKDGQLQVVVIPETPNIEFHYVDMIEGRMGAQWKWGEPLVKVYGTIVVNGKNTKTNIDQVTSIFVQTVPEFSFKKEEMKEENGMSIYQKN